MVCNQFDTSLVIFTRAPLGYFSHFISITALSVCTEYFWGNVVGFFLQTIPPMVSDVHFLVKKIIIKLIFFTKLKDNVLPYLIVILGTRMHILGHL